MGHADYQRLKEQLSLIRSVTPKCRFVDLLGQRPDLSVFIYVDSEPPESEDYSPPGQNYEESPAEYLHVFATEKPSTEGPVSDRWGQWVSCLVPLTDPETSQLVAVLGMDVEERDWTQWILAWCIAPTSITALLLVTIAASVPMRHRATAERQRLAAAEAKYRTLFMKSHNAIMTLEPPSWRFTSANPATLSLFKAGSAHDFRSLTPWDLSPERQPNGRASREMAMEQVEVAMREGSCCFEWTHASIGDEPFPAVVLLSRMDAGEGCILQATVRNTTAQKRAEEGLRSAKAFLGSIIDAIGDPVFVKDDQRRFVLVNAALCAMVGRSIEELIGRDGDDMFPPEQVETFRKTDAGVLETGEEILNEEGLSNLSTGKVRTIVTRKSRYTDPAGTSFIVGVIRDVTEYRAMEDLRRQIEAHLQRQQRLAAVGTLARGMAHEINNPLAGIMNYAQLIQDKACGDAKLAAFAGEIMAESRRIAAMTHGLLGFSRRKTTQIVVPLSPVELARAVSPTAVTEARQRGITLHNNIPMELSSVTCRLGQAARVVTALLTNAMEALDELPPGSSNNRRITLDAEIMTRETQSEESGRSGIRAASERWLRLTVEDSGPGIPMDIRDRVFDPFFTTKDRTRHPGLGLWISRSIVHEEGGELSVECEAGRWTKFHVDLPLVRI